jgi:hypothetical protein
VGGGTATDVRTPRRTVGARRRGALCRRLGLSRRGTVVHPTPTPTATPTANTDCPPTLTVSELDEEPDDIDSAVAYENLTAEQRATFDRARNGSAGDFDYAWHDIDLVAHDGTYYRAGIVVC